MEILDSLSGFLNNDNLKDIIVVLKLKNEKDFVNSDKNEPIRSVLILMGQPDGSLQLATKCDRAVMPFYVGGMGDPFSKISIDKREQFTILHSGGSGNNRWETVSTFKLDSLNNEFILESNFSRGFIDDDNQTLISSKILTSKEFGWIKFSEYSVYKEY